MEVEASSPLAAMQPAFRHHSSWPFGTDMARPSPRPLGGALFGPKLNLALKESYFDLDTTMESSPTSSLVADLSQNFHIDKTPQIPTPRRSLFTSITIGGFNGRSSVTTPPIPTSSPGGMDSMDISPLPHKAPYSALRSPPTPEININMNLCSSPPIPSPEPPKIDVILRETIKEPSSRMDPPPPTRRPMFERKRSSTLTRPSLLRQNRFTTNSVSFKAQSSAPPISFGRATTAPQINLEELFGAASPEKEKKFSPDRKYLAPPPNKPFTLGSLGSSPMEPLDGSPIAPLSRPTRPNFQRPKGKVRRTLSMFEHPEEVMQREKEQEQKSLGPAAELTVSQSPRVDPGENSYLPCFNVKDDPLRRIDRSVLCKVMDGRYKENYDECLIVDCRFEYEYDGGHIAGAINVNSIDVLEEEFFTAPKATRQLIIFHCEYSAHRAPRMALHLRKRDRQVNMHRYPALYYPDIYILQGGYSSFFNEHSIRCEPQDYVEMGDEKHKRTCEREMSRFRRNTKFARTQSFTYGAQQGDLDGSPSANVTRRPAVNCGRDGGQGSFGQISNRGQRRMASY